MRLTPRRTGALLLCALVPPLLATCGGSDSGTDPDPVDDPVASVTIAPATPSVDIGETLTLTATVLTEGGRDVTGSSTITWSSVAPTVASVSGSGATAVVTGVGRGTASIRATAGGEQGAVSVTVVDPNRPEAPSSVAAVPVSNSRIEIAWTDNADNETGFTIERETVSAAGVTVGGPQAAFEEIDKAGVNATAYVDTDIDPAATYRYLVRACNDNGCSPPEGGAGEDAATSDPVSVLGGAPTITTTSVPGGQFDVAYSRTLDVIGGDGTYDWTVADGALPDGLELDADDGVISGVPETLGTFDFTVQVTSDGESDQQELTIEVTESELVLDTYYLEGGSAGEVYVSELTSRGGDGTRAFGVTAGALPAGLVLDAETGALTGTPAEAGLFYFTVEVNSGAQSDAQTYAVAISSKPSSAFNMWAANANSGLEIPDPAVIEAMTEALARWEQHIVGELPDVQFEPDDLNPTDCSGDGVRMNGQFVDDMVILLELTTIDGPGGTLGSAGPCWVRLPEGGVNTVFGRLRLDTEDLVNLDDHQRMMLTFHEIGHIVGLGTFWALENTNLDRPNLLSCLSLQQCAGDEPRYLGEGGNTVFVEDLGGGSQNADRIPVEDDGGGGTAFSHWDEGEFNTEVMTGFSESSGVNQRISAMTIAAVGDLAYEVTTEGADPYGIPACAPACAVAPLGVQAPGGSVLDLRDDILRVPIGARLPDGTVIWIQPPSSR